MTQQAVKEKREKQAIPRQMIILKAKPLLWNGDHLGTFPLTNIFHEDPLGPFRCARLGLGPWGLVSALLMSESKGCEMVLADELKEVFNLPKLGTHRVTFGSQKYILIRPSVEGDRFVPDQRLHELRDKAGDICFRKMVREVLVFRLLLQTFTHHEHTVLVREVYKEPTPISFNERKLFYRDYPLSRTVQDRWFGEIQTNDGLVMPEVSITDVTRQMLQISNFNEEGEAEQRLLKFRDRVESTIMRIDREKIWMAASILSRVHQYLDLV